MEFLGKLRGAKGFSEEKLQKLSDLLSSFLEALEKEERNVSFLRRCAFKIQRGLGEIKLASLAVGGVLIAPAVLPKLDENLKAWDDIAPPV